MQVSDVFFFFVEIFVSCSCHHTVSTEIVCIQTNIFILWCSVCVFSWLVLATKMFIKGCMNANDCKLKATSVAGDRGNAELCSEVHKIVAGRRMLDDSRTLYVSNLPPKITVIIMFLLLQLNNFINCDFVSDTGARQQHKHSKLNWVCSSKHYRLRHVVSRCSMFREHRKQTSYSKLMTIGFV